jgi:hypothetical protein
MTQYWEETKKIFETSRKSYTHSDKEMNPDLDMEGILTITSLADRFTGTNLEPTSKYHERNRQAYAILFGVSFVFFPFLSSWPR